MGFLILIVELYFAAMLGISGLAKFEDVDYFANTLRVHKILPSWSIAGASRVIPCIEVLVAASLIVGTFSIATAAIVLVLFVSFLVIETILTLTKRTTDCGCYGAAYPQKIDGTRIIVSMILTLLALFHLWLVRWVEPIRIEWRIPVMIISLSAGIWLALRIMAKMRVSKSRIVAWSHMPQSEH